MERLSIDEVIEHCNKTCDMTEKIANARGHELQSIESKQFWEHYQVREWLKELKKYKDAKEQGLLLRLPCKVGDWLYYPCSYYNVVVPVRLNDVSISFIGLENYSYQYNCCSFDGCGDVYEDYEFDNDDIGKTVFLTKEEAEQALKQMGE